MVQVAMAEKLRLNQGALVKCARCENFKGGLIQCGCALNHNAHDDFAAAMRAATEEMAKAYDRDIWRILMGRKRR